MKKIILILTFVFFVLSLISCKTNRIITNSNLESNYYTDSIFSNYLSEYRKHNVYLPKNFNPKNKYPIIYATDGNIINENNFYKKTLDSLINKNIIKPIILITSYSNKKVADSTSVTSGNGKKVYLQYRNFEYINDYAKKNTILFDRFENHMLYFKDELIKQVESDFNQKLNKEDRFFYGVSNGAGFGLSFLNTNPDVIGTYICFSTFGGDIQTNTWYENIKYPNLYLRYGNQEPPFLKIEAEFLKSKYNELNLFAEITEFDGGHDYKKWNEEFIKIISKLFINQ
jgi:enterochelin esterase-like enzyme